MGKRDDHGHDIMTKHYTNARNSHWQDVARPVDWVFVSVALLLTAVGLVMAYSTTFFWSHVSEGSPLVIFGRQVLFAGLGLLAFALSSRLDYGLYRRLAIPIMAGCLLVLIGVILFGDDVFGARRTLLNGSVQPSELVKLGVIIYAAAWLASRRDQVRSVSNGLLPFGVIIGSVCFLIVIQPDLSTAVVITIAAAVMFFLAGASWQQLGLVALTAAAAFGMLIATLPYATARLNEFLKVWQTPDEMNYHIRQSLITLGSGGLFGNGIGASGQKFGYLPTPHTDSVLAVLGEELGLIGLIFVLALFALFVWRGLRIAQQADTAFGALIAIGVVTWVIAQLLLNLLATLAIIPFTGVPVPFLSVGGSSLFALLLASGVVVSIGRGSHLPNLEPTSIEYTETAKAKVKGGKPVRAHSAFRRRNSRTRFARAYRVESAHSASAFFRRVQPFKPERGHSSTVRRRSRWYGT
jgi:cell division protein FtsW